MSMQAAQEELNTIVTPGDPQQQPAAEEPKDQIDKSLPPLEPDEPQEPKIEDLVVPNDQWLLHGNKLEEFINAEEEKLKRAEHLQIFSKALVEACPVQQHDHLLVGSTVLILLLNKYPKFRKGKISFIVESKSEKQPDIDKFVYSLIYEPEFYFKAFSFEGKEDKPLDCMNGILMLKSKCQKLTLNGIHVKTGILFPNFKETIVDELRL